MARRIDTEAEIDWIRLADQVGDPASPAAGYKYVYVKSGGLYLVNSAGTVVGPIKTVATDTIWDTAGDLVYATGADAASKLVIGTAAQVLTVNAGATAPEWADHYLPNIIPIPIMFSTSNVNWNSVSATAASDYYLLSSGAQNDEVVYNINIPAGTYTWGLFHLRDTNRGIYTLYADGASKGTIDGYAAASVLRSTVTGITLPSASPTAIKIKMATKNGSASSYYGTIFESWLIRTGA